MDFRTRLAMALGQMQLALIESQMQNEDLAAQLEAASKPPANKDEAQEAGDDA